MVRITEAEEIEPSSRPAVRRHEKLAQRFGPNRWSDARHSWKTPACPMSSASFASAGATTLAAWESRDNVFLAKLTTEGEANPISPVGPTRRKHPSLATNSKGEILLVWTEGTAWGRGGNIAWQRYDRDLKPIGAPGRAEGLPAWSLAAAVAQPDSTFQIIY